MMKGVSGRIWLLLCIIACSGSVLGKTGRIRAPVISYRPDLIFHPGSNPMIFRVKEGAPCTVYCTVSKDKNILIWPEVSTFEVFVNESGENYEKNVNFNKPGKYLVSCQFDNTVSNVDVSQSITVSEIQHPVTIKTNSPVAQGDPLRATFNLGGWSTAREVTGEAYYRTTITRGLYSPGSSQEFKRNKISKEFKLTQIMEQPGTRYLRFNLFVELNHNVSKTIQLVTRVTVLDVARSLNLKVFRAVSPRIFEKSFVIKKDESQTAKVSVPMREEIQITSTSENMVTNWEWKSSVGILSKKNTFTFVPTTATVIHGAAYNKFSRIDFKLAIIPLSYGKNLLILSRGQGERGDDIQFSIVITSDSPQQEFSATSEFTVAVDLSLSLRGRMTDFSKKKLEYATKDCFDNSKHRLESYIESWHGVSPLPYHNYDSVKSFCVLNFTHSFSKFGSYKIAATARNALSAISGRNDFCVSDFASCEAASVKIVKPPGEKDINFKQDRDVYLSGEFIKNDCPQDKREKIELEFTWYIKRFRDGWESIEGDDSDAFFDEDLVMVTGNHSELFIRGRSLTEGRYQVLFRVSESPYCGEQPLHASDPVYINVLPGPLQAMIHGGSQSLFYVGSKSTVFLKSEIQYKRKVNFTWFCWMQHQQIQFNDYFYTDSKEKIEADHKGCFGRGFMVKADKDVSYSNETLSIPASKFSNIPNSYIFRLLVGDDKTTAYDDHRIELRAESAQTHEILDAISTGGSDKTPRVIVECLANCDESLVVSHVLHLKANCENCITDSQQPFEIKYEWDVETPVLLSSHLIQNTDWMKYSYTKNTGEPNFRLKPYAFTQIGEYKISVQMEAKYNETFQNVPIGRTHYSVHVTEEPPPPTCFVRPTSGTVLLTKFEIGCHLSALSESVHYQMFYSDCHACNAEDESYTLFYQGYINIAKGILLPMGERQFGYKLMIKIKSLDEKLGVSSESYVFVYVHPIGKADYSESLLTTINQALESFASRKDAIKFGQVAMAAMSLNKSFAGDEDESLTYALVQSILRKMEDLKPSSEKSANVLSHVLEKSLEAASKFKNYTNANMKILLSAEKAISLQAKYLTETSSGYHSPDEVELLAKSLTSAVSNGMQMVATYMNGAAGTKVAREGLSSSLDTIAMALSGEKTFGEQSTDIFVNGLQMSVAKSKLKRGSKSISQQPGLVLSGENPSRDWDIQSAVTKFSFNPLPKYAGAENGETTAVVAMSIRARILNAGNRTFGKNRPRQRSTEREVATKFLSNRTVHVLLPFQKDQLKLSKAIALPKPCPQDDIQQSSAGTIGEPCGNVVTTLRLGTDLRTGRKRDIISSVGNDGHVVIRPSRPCRIPEKPCIKVSFLRVSSTAAHDNSSFMEVENGKCPKSEVNAKKTSCFQTYEVVSTVILPRMARTVLPPEFYPDSWSIPVPDAVGISSGENSVVIVLEHLQNDYTSQNNELSSYQSVTLSIVSVSCAVWDNKREEWSSDLCGAGQLSEGNMIHCQCGPQDGSSNDLSSLNAGAADASPLFFATSFIILPNEIDFADVVALFFQMRTNYYALAFTMFYWAILVVSFIWARKTDDMESSTTGVNIPNDNNPCHGYLYEVVVTTAVVRGAGTTAKVKIILEGSFGVSSEAHVITNKYHTTLQRSSKDAFLIATAQSLGQIERIHLWHDNTGDYPSWHVNRVAVFDLQDHERAPSYFLVNAWLSQDIYPYRCQTTVTRTNEKKILSFISLWKMYFVNLLDEDDVWVSLFFKSRCSPFTRVQRLACLVTAVFGCMLVTNMFIETVVPEYYSFEIGFVKIDLSPLVIAIEGCVVTVPLSYLHVIVFNRLETKDERVLESLVGKSRQNIQRQTVKHSNVKLSHFVPYNGTLEGTHVPAQFPPYSSQRKGNFSRIKNCIVTDLDPPSQEHFAVESSSEAYMSCEEDFDVLETLRTCLQIKEIAERISTECKKVQTSASNAMDVKVRVKDIPIFEEVPVEAKKAVYEQASRREKSGKDSRGRHVWYKRFKAKRLLRRGRERTGGMEDGQRFTALTASSHSISVSGDTDSLLTAYAFSGKDARLSNASNLLKDIVFLPKIYSTFPGWTSTVVWVLTWLYLLTCSAFSLLYGLFYDKKIFFSWLTTFILSLFQSVFVIAPLRISATAAIVALMNKKKIDVQQWAAYSGPAARADAVLRWRKLQQTPEQKGSSEHAADRQSHESIPGDNFLKVEEIHSDTSHRSPRPSVFETTTFRLMKSGKRSLAVRQVKRYWAETIIWICIAAFVTALIVFQRDPRLNRISNMVNFRLQKDARQLQIKTDVYEFLDDSVIPLLFKMHENSHLEQTRLLGTIRLRQLRFPKEKNCSSRVAVYNHCSRLHPNNDVVSAKYFDVQNYSASWVTSHYTGKHSFYSPWRYVETGDTDGTHFKPGSALHRPFYPAGGYITDLGYQPKQAFSIIKSLRHERWIDRYSAAVIIEFASINIVTGHITAITYVVEFLDSGGINVFQQSHSYRPVYMYEMKDVIIIGLQFLHLGITCFLGYSIITEFSESKWNPITMINLCSDVWHILQISTIIVTFTAYGYYVKHVVIAAESSYALNRDPSQFVTFSKAAYYNIIYQNLISFAAFLCYVRILKIMRGSQSVSIMVDTLAAAYEGIWSVVVLLAVVTAAFSITGTTLFGSSRWNFHQIFTATTSLTSMAAGMDIPHPDHGVTADILWSVYFLLMTIFVLGFYSNLYAAVVSDALFFTRNEATKETSHRVETLALHWVYEKAAGFFGFKSQAFSGKRINLRRPPGSVLQENLADAMRLSLTFDPADASKKCNVERHKRRESAQNGSFTNC